MTWFKVDDAFHSHPKILACPPAALGLWVVAGSWSSSHMTGGIVPYDILPRLVPGGTELAEHLVTAGLWKPLKTGYKFHDWKIYNPTAQEARRTRALRAAAGRKGGLASGNARSKTEAKGSAVASAALEPPTRPDPSNGSVVTGTGRGAASRHPSARSLADALKASLHPDDTQGSTQDDATER